MMSLRNDHLTVQLQTPGLEYRGSRYDWSSFITSVILRNQYEFLGVESPDPMTGNGGKGLCGEFGKTSPLGFKDASPGDYFVKMGVGLVKRVSSGNYNFSVPSQVKPLEWFVETTNTALDISCHQRTHNGYGYKLHKKISLKEDTICIRYILRNTGGKPIITDEYSHNYITMAQSGIDEAYTLSVGHDPVIETCPQPFAVADKTFHFPQPLKETFYHEDSFETPAEETHWQMKHRNLNLQVEEVLDKPISSFAVFGTPAVLCPELCVHIHCEPGEEFSWQRIWEFCSL